MLAKCGERETLIHYWRTVNCYSNDEEQRFLKMPNVDLPKDFTSYSTDTCSAMFIATPFKIARNQKQPQCYANDD